jgi:hypothetical protein
MERDKLAYHRYTYNLSVIILSRQVGGWRTLDQPTKAGCPILSTVSSWKGWEPRTSTRRLFLQDFCSQLSTVRADYGGEGERDGQKGTRRKPRPRQNFPRAKHPLPPLFIFKPCR